MDKALDNLQTILAVAGLLCLIAGTYYNSQIYTYLSEAPEPATATLTVTVASTISTSSTCTVHPCNYTEVISETIGITPSLSAIVMHAAAQKAAQEAWYWKSVFDYWGTALLVLYLALLGIRFVVGRKYLAVLRFRPKSHGHAVIVMQRPHRLNIRIK